MGLQIVNFIYLFIYYVIKTHLSFCKLTNFIVILIITINQV